VVLDKEISGARIAKSIKKAMDEPENLQKMENNSYRLGSRDATKKVQEICLELMGDARKVSEDNNESKEKHVLSCF